LAGSTRRRGRREKGLKEVLSSWDISKIIMRRGEGRKGSK